MQPVRDDVRLAERREAQIDEGVAQSRATGAAGEMAPETVLRSIHLCEEGRVAPAKGNKHLATL